MSELRTPGEARHCILSLTLPGWVGVPEARGMSVKMAVCTPFLHSCLHSYDRYFQALNFQQAGVREYLSKRRAAR